MKKEKERVYLNALLAHGPNLAVTNVVETEEPDFVGTVGARKVGIELTSFFFPQKGGLPHAARDRYRQQLARELVAEHIKRSLPPIRVVIHLADSADFVTLGGRARLRALLLDFVEKLDFSGSGMCEVEPTLKLYGAGCSIITVHRTPKLSRPEWALPYAAFIPESSSQLIQAIVDRKGKRLPQYRKKADEIWLVIVSGTAGLHSIIDLDRDVATAGYLGEFDRLFLLKGITTHELKLRAPAAS